jgi:hypothetical protein
MIIKETPTVHYRQSRKMKNMLLAFSRQKRERKKTVPPQAQQGRRADNDSTEDLRCYLGGAGGANCCGAAASAQPRFRPSM